MDEARITHGRQETVTRFQCEKLKERDHSGIEAQMGKNIKTK